MVKLDASKCLQMQGLYDFELKNTKTGEIKKYHTHNVVLIYNMLSWMFANYMGDGGFPMTLTSIQCGAGTTEPSADDTELEKQLFSSSSVTAKTQGKFDYEKSKIMVSAFFPADTSHVGDITEVGINTSGGLLTHGLVKDSEGNPIKIPKTDTDELTINATLITTFTRDADIIMSRGYSPFMLGKAMRDAPYDIRWSVIRVMISALPVSEGGACQQEPDDTGWASFKWNKTDKKVVYNQERWGTQNDFGRHYIRRFGIGASNGAIFQVPFPNASIFPQRTLKGLSLGTGDGSKTEFVPILPYWVKDTEKIYKNGAVLTRGVDYICSSNGNAKKDSYAAQSCYYDEIIQGVEISSSSGDKNIPFASGATVSTDGYKQKEEFISIHYPKNEENAMIIKYKTDPLLGNKVNYIHLPIKVDPWSNYSQNKTYIIHIAFSEDGDNFSEVPNKITYTIKYDSDSDWHADFAHDGKTGDCTLSEPITMNYLKLWYTNEDGSDASGNINTSDAWIGYVGKGIVFTNPPAAGDILTMDADIDRPWKDENYIFDFGCEIQF